VNIVSRNTNDTNFNILQLNIHSLRNKLPLLEAEIQAIANIDIVILSETWIEPNTDQFYNLPGFSSEHVTREDGYGGLSVFVKGNLNYRVKQSLTILGNTHIIILKLLGINLNILIYRPPGNDTFTINGFLNILDGLLEDNTDCIVAGDININLLNDNITSRLYKTTIEANGYYVLNKIEHDNFTFPIENGPGQPGSILDHFFTDITEKEYNLSNFRTTLSEHHCLILEVKKVQSSDTHTKKTKTVHKKVLSETRQFLQQCPNTTLQNIHTFLTDSIQRNSFENSQTQKDGKLPWVDEEVLVEMRHRDFLFYIKQIGSEQEKRTREKIFKKQKNKVTSLIKSKTAIRQ
jgi:exonuclease III